MATIATEAAMAWIVEQSPVRPAATYVEANFSGDKKASAQSFQTVRGQKVTAEVILPAELVRTRLHTTPEQMVDYSRMATMGGVLSGTLGAQGHYANGLAALFIACGQDAACVAEAAVGTTRCEVTADGGLRMSRSPCRISSSAPSAAAPGCRASGRVSKSSAWRAPGMAAPSRRSLRACASPARSPSSVPCPLASSPAPTCVLARACGSSEP